MLFRLDRSQKFKDWTKPGPVVGAETEIPEDESLDAISGYYRLFQLKGGHRFSTDDLLTAWYGTSWCPRAERVLDLGSGVGSVGMIAAWRLPGARFVTIEAQAESVRLARKSAAFNGLESRYEIRQGDFRDESMLGADQRFDLVLGSPPYFAPGSGVEGDHPQKVACRFELRGSVVDYCAVAAKHLSAGGFFACVFPTEATQLARVEAGARAAELVIIRRRPVILREGEPPLLALFGMMRRENLPAWMADQSWLEPPLVIRTAQGGIHPEYSTVKLSLGFPP